MAGGKGSRMQISSEKLILKYKKQVILHVFDALQNAKTFSQIIAATSPHSPQTKSLLLEHGIKTVDAPGRGYVLDLNLILNNLDDFVLVVSGDLPLLDATIIKKIIELHDKNNVWTSYVLTKEFLDSNNIDAEFSVIVDKKECFYSGIYIVNAKEINNLDDIEEKKIILDDKRIAFNLNTKKDYEIITKTLENC